MSEPSLTGPSRRRSSMIAYDPARDTFTEIPNNLPDKADAEADPELRQSSEAIISSPPPEEAAPEESKKRRRSEPAETQRRTKPDGAADGPDGPPTKKRRPSPPALPSPTRKEQTSQQSTDGVKQDKPGPKSVSDLPRVPRRPREEGEISSHPPAPAAYSRRPDGNNVRPNGRPWRRRSQSPHRRSPTSVYRRRSPPRERPRSPSPIRASPPREIIRPGGARGRGRNVLADQQRLQAERERQNAPVLAQTKRGVQDVSNQFYNTRPEWVKERGRDWRKNESQIKNLRSFNNWVKSCLIQKFSPQEKGEEEELGWGEEAKEPEARRPLLVLDIGCGKGGDLGKWQLAPQPVELYVGLDPAETSIRQARDRYEQMRRSRRPIFDARFVVKDCFGEWIGDVGIVREVGIDPHAGSGQISRWGGGGFDVVTAMFTMHYSFESEEKVRMMLRNVAGSLKKGGRFIGVVPNSDVLAARIRDWFKKKGRSGQENEANGPVDGTQKSDGAPGASEPGAREDDEGPSWGNSIYSVRFPPDPLRPLNPDGTFRPPFSWKYMYWMTEAVDVPEFVVPWEAFRAIAEGFNLEQRYRKPFLNIWETEKQDREMAQLGVRMGVVQYEGGELLMSPEEREAVEVYHGFCFVKV